MYSIMLKWKIYSGWLLTKYSFMSIKGGNGLDPIDHSSCHPTSLSVSYFSIGWISHITSLTAHITIKKNQDFSEIFVSSI